MGCCMHAASYTHLESECDAQGAVWWLIPANQKLPEEVLQQTE